MTNLFKNKRIGKKLQIAFGMIIAIFVVATMTAIVSITMINNKMEDFYNRPYTNNVLQMEIRRDVQYAGKQLLWAMTTVDEDESNKHIDEASSQAEKVAANIEKLSKTFKNEELLKQLNAAFVVLKEERIKVSELAAANQNEEALAIYNAAYNTATEEMQDVLAEISTYADQVAVSAYQSAASLGTVATVLMIGTGILCILFCIYVASLITKSIKEPVQELAAAAKKLSRGELDVEIGYESSDELGGLADSFRTAFGFMQAVIIDMSHMLEEVSKGNFRVESKEEDKYIGEFSNILKSMQELLVNLDHTLKQINEGSGQVAVGAGQMAENAQSLAEGAAEQAGAIEELTATVENVSGMAIDAARSARESADNTRESAKQAVEGQRSMQELVKAMDNISNVSQEIQNIIGAIEDIAAQTNLLSLNASIEAARAGEAGRGFAVVADQIGKLASDSADSAVETRELISKSLEEVRNGNEITRKTVGVLENIIKDINNFTEVSTASSEAANSQAEMLKQVQEGIEQIASVVQSNSAAAQETSATSEELSAQSENLKALVDQFRLKD